ncbi:hypothetical protein [Mesorhizobium sp.]|nr:hypothetical protein [Mesorhizobium sp.]
MRREGELVGPQRQNAILAKEFIFANEGVATALATAPPVSETVP